MRKLSMAIIVFVLLLGGCAPNFSKEEEIVQEQDDSTKTAIIPKYQISEQFYRTLLPFEPSASRGLTVNKLRTRHDIDEFETGLMRVAQNTFNPDKYLFQEGQYLDKDTVKKWLRRAYTEAEIENSEDLNPEDNLGLNPADSGKGSIQERNEENPIYLAQILEHNYIINEEGTAKLGGVVIGLAMNSVHYYQKEQYGPIFDVDIDDAEIEKEGKKIAHEVVNRLRQIKDLEEVPITIALFKQESRSSVVPGNFLTYATVGKGTTKLSSWNAINEDYVLFPSDYAQKNHRDDFTTFQNFKEDVEEYFPNFNGVIGTAFYAEDQLRKLSIDITIQFYGKAETIGFTQYVTGLVMEHFPNYISVEVSVSTVDGKEALIVKEVNQDKPFVHIYEG